MKKKKKVTQAWKLTEEELSINKSFQKSMFCIDE